MLLFGNVNNEQFMIEYFMDNDIKISSSKCGHRKRNHKQIDLLYVANRL